MPKVSVIIPIYGVERYIERCARSLFEQTLDDMEFIFVNDQTKDNSIEILDNIINQYPARKKQTTILHQEKNMGASHAREAGIKRAAGEYIAHCDSDDWVDCSMYEEMYTFATKGRYDYVKCAHFKTDGNNKNIVYHAKTCTDMSKESIISLMLQDKGWDSIWNTLVKKDLYRESNLIFTDDAMLEDFFLTAQLLLHSKKIGYLNKPYYNYFVNEDSICNEISVESYINRTKQAKKNMDWIISYLSSNLNICADDIVAAKWVVKNHLVPIMDKQENKKYWNMIYPELRYEVIKANTISLRNKLRFYSVEFNLYKYFKR